MFSRIAVGQRREPAVRLIRVGPGHDMIVAAELRPRLITAVERGWSARREIDFTREARR